MGRVTVSGMSTAPCSGNRLKDLLCNSQSEPLRPACLTNCMLKLEEEKKISTVHCPFSKFEVTVKRNFNHNNLNQTVGLKEVEHVPHEQVPEWVL